MSFVHGTTYASGFIPSTQGDSTYAVKVKKTSGLKAKVKILQFNVCKTTILVIIGYYHKTQCMITWSFLATVYSVSPKYSACEKWGPVVSFFQNFEKGKYLDSKWSPFYLPCFKERKCVFPSAYYFPC